jgi:hypothetical protein
MCTYTLFFFNSSPRMSINYTRFSRTDSLIIHGPWDHGRRRLGEKNTQSKETDDEWNVIFYLYDRLFFR